MENVNKSNMLSQATPELTFEEFQKIVLQHSECLMSGPVGSGKVTYLTEDMLKNGNDEFTKSIEKENKLMNQHISNFKERERKYINQHPWIFTYILLLTLMVGVAMVMSGYELWKISNPIIPVICIGIGVLICLVGLFCLHPILNGEFDNAENKLEGKDGEKSDNRNDI